MRRDKALELYRAFLDSIPRRGLLSARRLQGPSDHSGVLEVPPHRKTVPQQKNLGRRDQERSGA